MKFIPIVVLAAVVATPAFAGHARQKRLPLHSHGYFLQQHDWRDSRNQYRGGEYLRGPNVYSPSGRFVGRDPSPNVRQRMYDDDLRFRGPP
jgi:hypothetical protein